MVVFLFQERSRGTFDASTTPPESVHASLTCDFHPQAEREGEEGGSQRQGSPGTGEGDTTA